MDSLVRLILHNAAGATVVALAVVAITRVWRHPQVTYLLWLLVLLKLLVPPIGFVRLPLLRGEQRRVQPTDNVRYDRPAGLRSVSRRPSEKRAGLGHPVSGSASTRPFPEGKSEEMAYQAEGCQRVDSRRDRRRSWVALALSVWLAGSMIWLAVTVRRVLRVHVSIRGTLPGSESLRKAIQELAGQLGLRRCPEVRIVEGAIAPMVWCMRRRPLVVLPRQLVEDLPGEQVRAILAHELAHVRRRDHWMRWLEACVAAVYWWHPVAWWACRRLREAQELCCDALVLGTFPRFQSGYAKAIVRTIEFVSGVQPPPPVVASGFGQLGFLKRRIEMILQSRPATHLSTLAKTGVLGFAVLVLPWSVQAVPGQVSSPQVSSEAPESKPEPATSATSPFARQKPIVESDAQTEASNAATRALLEAIRNEDKNVRLRAVKAISDHGVGTKGVLLALTEAVKDKDEKVGYMAVWALKRLGGGSKETIQALLVTLKDKDVATRARAATALGNIGAGSEEAVGGLISALKDEAPHVRRNAANSLGEISGKSSRAVRALAEALKDKDAAVGQSAANALAKIAAAGSGKRRPQPPGVVSF